LPADEAAIVGTPRFHVAVDLPVIDHVEKPTEQ
jgi:hypothetical protein